ncbi:MAG: dephospho-CoA kinase [Planctomycetota bacterium]
MNETHGRTDSDTYVVGLLGGIASGKSTVARMLEENGFHRIDADRIAHEVLQQEEIQNCLADEFGDEILGRNGGIDHARLAEAAFDSRRKLEKLNDVVHPPVIRRIDAEIDGATGPVVLDAALLVEKGLDRRYCDLLIFVDAPEEQRRERVNSNRGWNPEELRRREKHQISTDRKRNIADKVVTNDETHEKLHAQIQSLVQKIQNQTD